MREVVITRIKRLLGPDGYLEDSTGRQPFCRDWTGAHTGDCLLVAQPESTEKTSDLIRLCAENNLTVIPQGGNTSLSFGAVPGSDDKDVIMLSTRRLNQIQSVSTDGFSLVAESGATLQAVQDAAMQQDRLFALDIGARGSCTIGGCVSTNAGGLNTLRYGNCRDQVLGLEVVLPDGRIWNGLRRLRKDNSGYDLKQLFIGSEGTLGVITRVALLLHPKPCYSVTTFVSLTNLASLAPLLAASRNIAGDLIDALELVPEALVQRTVEKFEDIRRPVETRAEYYALIRLSAMHPVEPITMHLLEFLDQKNLISDAMVAKSGLEENMLWKMRESAMPKMLFEGDMIHQDASLPLDKIADYLIKLKKDLAQHWPGAWLYTLGHVGDGNQHITIMGHKFEQRAEIVGHINQLVWENGGSVSAEHGIGQKKKEAFLAQKSNVELLLMKGIKASIDPENLFNPSVLFD